MIFELLYEVMLSFELLVMSLSRLFCNKNNSTLKNS